MTDYCNGFIDFCILLLNLSVLLSTGNLSLLTSIGFVVIFVVVLTCQIDLFVVFAVYFLRVFGYGWVWG